MFGVRSAMPSVTAKRRCPDLIFVKPRFDIYMAVSLQIREIFAEYTPIIEPLSLDEAYLDVTLNLKGLASATKIAEGIRTTIRRETNLTASVDLGRPRLAPRSHAHWGHPLARDSLVRGLGQEEAKRRGRTESDQLELHQLPLWT
jgi:nucleotidyltransferase/DNA polymerase involved in DNA repair